MMYLMHTPHVAKSEISVLEYLRNGARGLILAGLWHAVPNYAAASNLGTLFYTPAERQAISQAQQPMEGSGASTTIHLSGVVARAASKGSVWVNGKMVIEGAPSKTHIRGTDALVDGKRLRVGESVDPITGERSDLVAPGAVTIRRHP